MRKSLPCYLAWPALKAVLHHHSTEDWEVSEEYQTPAENNSLNNTVNKDTNETTETAEGLQQEQEQQFHALDQRNIVSTSALISDQVSIPQEVGMSKDIFEATDMFQQPIKIGNYVWSSSMTVNTIIANFELPAIFESTDSYALKLLAMYSYYKPIFKLKFVINTMKMHQGKLLVIYDPMNVQAGAGDAGNIFRSTGMPFGELDAGDSNSVEMEIPFEYFYNYFSTIDENPRKDTILNMGAIRIQVLNQLQEVTGASSDIPVTVWLWADSIQHHVPIQAHIKNTLTAKENYKQNLRAKLDRLEQQGGWEDFKSGFSKGFGAVKNIASSAIGVYADVKTGNISGAFEKAGGLFDFDRPDNLEAHACSQVATTAPLCYMFGPDNAVRLSSDPMSNYVNSSFSVVTAKETEISTIIQKPQMFTQFIWNATTTPDTVLLDIPVMPNENYSVQTTTISGQTLTYADITPTHLSYYSYLFDQWSGDIIYRFSFASTQFHSGRIQIAFEPGVQVLYDDLTTTPSVAKASAGPNFVFDLREHKEVVVRVAYNSTTTTKKTLPQYFVQNPGTISGDPFIDNTYTLGRLRVIAVTPLIKTDNVADNVQCNVWVAGGENFAYDFPIIRQGVMNEKDFEANFPITFKIDRLEQQSDFDAGGRNDALQATNLLKGPSGLQMENRFGERMKDVRDYATRYGYTYTSSTFSSIGPIKTANINLKLAPQTHWVGLPFILNSFQYPITAATANFVWWSGSLRTKIVPITSRTDNILFDVAYEPYCWNNYVTTPTGLTPITANTGQPLHLQNISQDCGVEFETPFISQYNQLLLNNDAEDVAINNIELYTHGQINVRAVTDQASTRTELTYAVALAAGNDFMVRLNIAPPRLLIPISLA